MKRSSKAWSRSPSSNLWLPGASRRAVISGAAAGGAALLLGCGKDGNSKGTTTEGTGGAAESGGSGGAPGTGGTGLAHDAGATGGSTGGISPDAAAQASLDAARTGAVDTMLESDSLLVVPDGSVITIDGPAPTDIPALACTKRSEQIVGPYPAANVQLNRSDIRSDPGDNNMVKAGVPLKIVIRVGSKGLMGCSPLPGAIVNAWQCDAAGVYASYSSQGTAKNQYLRGYQMTDSAGVVVFQTIYPGSYAGRCVHTHFSVRMASQSFPSGGFVGQLYFPDDITTQVLMQAGYTSRDRVTNAQDGFYKSDMLGKVTREGNGYIAQLELAV